MTEWAVKQLMSNFPQIMGYFAVAIIVTIIVWKIAIFYNASKNVHKEFPDIKSLLSKIEMGLSSLNQVLLEKNFINQSCFSNMNSPRVINDVGQELLKESGSLKVYESVKDEFLVFLEAKKSQSLLELERESFNVFLDNMKDARFIPVQNWIFEHPVYKSNQVTYTDVLFLLGLKLRDYYREKHPELE